MEENGVQDYFRSEVMSVSKLFSTSQETIVMFSYVAAYLIND